MGTKTAVALSVACGALGTLVVTEGILPRLGDDPLHGRDHVAGAATVARLSAPAPDSGESDAAPAPGLPARVSPARQPLGKTELSREDLRKLLFSSDRIEQVRAIELLLAAGSVEANAVLLEAFFSTSDRVLLALLEEALLESTLDVAPSLVNAFLESQDPELLGRVSGLLARLVSARPELAPEVTGHLLGALQEASLFPERAGLATEVLVSLGIDAADEVGDYLTDRDSGPEGVGSAAWVLAQLPEQHGEVVREKLARSLRGSLEALGEWGLSAEEREGILQKTGSIAWATTLRPEEEHDRLGEVVLESLLATRDAAQASTLAWSLGNLEGLSARSRAGITGSLLEALDEEADDSLRQQYLRTVEQLAVQQPIGPTFHELMRLVQEARALRGDDGELTPHLDRLLARLQAYEEQESTAGHR